MKREITIIGAIVVWISLVGCNSSERAKLRGENAPWAGGNVDKYSSFVFRRMGK